MKIKDLLKHLKETKKKAGKFDVDVEFWVDDVEYEIDEIGQFSVIPDVMIHLKLKNT